MARGARGLGFTNDETNFRLVMRFLYMNLVNDEVNGVKPKWNSVVVLRLYAGVEGDVRSNLLHYERLRLRVSGGVNATFRDLLPNCSQEFVPITRALGLQANGVLPVGPRRCQVLLNVTNGHPGRANRYSGRGLLRVVLRSSIRVGAGGVDKYCKTPPGIVHSAHSVSVFGRCLPVFLLSFCCLLLQATMVEQLAYGHRVIQVTLRGPNVNSTNGLNVVRFLSIKDAAVSRANARAANRLMGRFVWDSLVKRTNNGSFEGRFLCIRLTALRVAIF